MENFTIGTKLKKEIEVEELIIYPFFRKMTDVLTGETITVFKVDEYIITKVICGNNLYPAIQVFENNQNTLSAVYWHEETTKQEYIKYLQQIKECIG